MPNVRVISDGTAYDTVVTTDDGKKIKGVLGISIELARDQANVVELTLAHSDMDIRGGLAQVTFVCPCCGETIVHKCESRKQPFDTPKRIVGNDLATGRVVYEDVDQNLSYEP